MRIAIFSESAADEAAIRVLVDALRNDESTASSMPPLRSRGWGAVHRALPMVMKSLHYHTDAEGLVVVADSNHSPLHQQEHSSVAGAAAGCRVCILRKIVEEVRPTLRAVPTKAMLRIAVGIAVPAIEAWYLCGVQPHVNEASWGRGLATRVFDYDKKHLKRLVYGTERPSIDLETRRGREECARVAANLSQRERLFAGFGALAEDLRRW